jgi:S-adenosylmethionine:tRNA ribosyltransferase-isomerase
MMVVSRLGGEIRHGRFLQLPEQLCPGDLVVANDTAVLACRLFAKKPTGGKVEILLLKPLSELEWSVLLSPIRGLSEGSRLEIISRKDHASSSLEVAVTSLKPDDFRITFSSAADQRAALERWGEMPLPPYIERAAPRAGDRERYQTCFAKYPGAAAAPTAGLHFTEALRGKLAERGIAWATVILHVGAGTFLPVRTERIDEHRIHDEYFEIPESTQSAIRECRQRGGRMIAVGTTTLRAVESWALSGKASGWTDLYIRPGFSFQVVDHLLTNFHQPRSTLLILVSALAGRELILRAYHEAIRERYRLFSYGDCMLIR